MNKIYTIETELREQIQKVGGLKKVAQITKMGPALISNKLNGWSPLFPEERLLITRAIETLKNQIVTKLFGDITIREWNDICDTYYICSDASAREGTNPCKNCPLSGLIKGSIKDCPMWDKDEVQSFQKEVTFKMKVKV